MKLSGLLSLASLAIATPVELVERASKCPASTRQAASARSAAKKASTPAPTPPQPTSSSVQPAADTSQPPAALTHAVTKSPDRQPSPDMDVDVGGTPEPEGVANQQ